MSYKQQAMPIMVNNYSRLFGVKVRMQGTVAYTNGKVITIPRMDITDSLKARIAYGYLAHESAHVRFTDFSILKEPLVRDNYFMFLIFNILEDCRIERLISKIYIGVYENLELLNDYYKKDWEFFLKTLSANQPMKVLLTFIQCYAQSYSQKFDSSRARAAVLYFHLRKRISVKNLNAIAAIVKTISSAENSKAVLLLCQSIMSIIESENFSFSDDKSLNVFEDLKKDSKLKSKFDEEVVFNKAENSEHKKRLALESAKLKIASGDDPKKITPGKSVDAIVEENSAGQDSSSREDFGEFNECICTEGRADFLDSVKDSYALRQSLSNQIRAYVQAHAMSCESGSKLNIKRAQFIPLGEKRIFKDRILQKDFSTSVHILVDVSSSMLTQDGFQTSSAEEACKAALMLSLALEGIDGLSSMATFFPGRSSEFEIALKAEERASRVAARFDQKPRGSTPLAQALWHAFACIEKLNPVRNIILVITDGMPDSVSNVNNCFTYAKEHNIEIYGLSIRSEMIKKVFSNAIILNNAKELSGSAFKLFKELFAVHNSQILE